LKSFSFEARYNIITDVTALATAIASFNPALTNLDISLGGFSLSKNTLTAESAKLLVRSFRHLSNLTVLSIDLGYTGRLLFIYSSFSQIYFETNFIFNFFLKNSMMLVPLSYLRA